MTGIMLAAINSFGASKGTLTLNALGAFGFDFSSPWSSSAAIKVNTNGEVQECSNGSCISQNAGVEWIDAFGASEDSSDYEAYMTKTSGTTPSGTAVDTWVTISSNLSWTLTRTSQGTTTFNGTLEIREIADTSNTTGAVSVIIECDNNPF